MPRATARRKDAAGVQFGGNSTNASDALGPQVFYDSVQIGGTLRGISLHCCDGLLVAYLLAPERLGAVRVA